MKIKKIEYVVLKQNKKFSEVEYTEYFCQGTHLYKKISNHDLDYYNIEGANAINILLGTLSYFTPDEDVNLVVLECE